MGSKGRVSVVWTVFEPTAGGGHMVFQRTERSFTVLCVGKDGQAWARSQFPRRAGDWESFQKDFRHAMAKPPPEPRSPAPRSFAELVRQWRIRIVEMPDVERLALQCVVKELAPEPPRAPVWLLDGFQRRSHSQSRASL